MLSVVRKGHPCTLRVAFVGLLFAAAPGAQEVLRRPLAGFAHLADGKAWAGAEIICLSRLLPDDPRTPADRVVAKSDQRGAFRARVLPSRTYSVWARARNGKRWLISKEFVAVAGDRVRLRALPAAAPGFRITAEGLEHWAELAPFRVALLSSSQNVEYLELPLQAIEDVRGSSLPKPQVFEATCPPFVGDSVLAEILGKGRVPVGKWNCNPGGGGRLVVKQGRERRVDVRALASARGVARVAVHAKTLRGDSALLARTDEGGFAKLKLPDAFIHEMFAVDDIDDALLAGQLRKGSYPQLVGKVLRADFHASLRHKSHERVRFLLDGQPLVGQYWSVASQLQYSLKRHHVITRPRRIVVQSDGQGLVGFEVPRHDAATGEPSPTVLAIDAKTLRRLGVDQLGVSPVVWSPAQPRRKASTLDVRSLRVVELEVVRADGSPARGARLRFLPRGSERRVYWPERCDRRGRWKGLLAPSRAVSLGVRGAQAAVAFVEIELPSLATKGKAARSVADPIAVNVARRPVALRVELRPGVPISGRVVDAADRPVAGAVVEIYCKDMFRPRRSHEPRIHKPSGARLEALDLAKYTSAAWQSGAFDILSAASNEQGRFVLHRPRV